MKYVCSLITVKDVNKAREFYETLLGQKVEYDFGENVSFEGGFAIHLENHYQKLIGEKAGSILRKSNNFELYFETDELESVLETLEKNNVEFLHKLVEQPWGQRVMRFYDRDYHIVEVGESMESVVLRYHGMGMNMEDISKRTSMPIEFVRRVLLAEQ